MFKFQVSAFLLLFTFTGLFYQCGNSSADNPFANCKYGAPQAIFSDQLPQVVKHSYRVNKDIGIEKLAFSNNIELEIIQSGCNEIIQEYQIKLKGDYQAEPPEFWLAEAARQLIFLGKFGEKYMIYNFWAQALADHKDNIKLGQNIELEEGYTIKIDKVASQEQALILLTLKGQL